MNQNIPSSLSIQTMALQNNSPVAPNVWSTFKQGNNYLISFGMTIYYNPLSFDYIYFSNIFYKKLQL
jgi:hypothetical protein